MAASSNICRRGDTFQLAAQVYNQGTTALTCLRTMLSVPAGDCITGLSLVTPATSPAVTAIAVAPAPFSCRTRTVAVAMRGTLVAGGAAPIVVTGLTVAGPGLPAAASAPPTQAPAPSPNPREISC